MFRKPWTNGAYAYPIADTFDDFREGMKRKRKEQWVLMPNTGEAGDRLCSLCGVKLRDKYQLNPGGLFDQQDKQSTWIYTPRTKTVVGVHYGCSWGAIFNAIAQIRI
jgi:hypothetical protein